MELIHTVERLRARLANEPRVAFVPTMGNLHAGHLALVEEARKHAYCVVASIFVNRLQFEPGADFDRYPRTLDADCAKLERAGCDVAFAPDEREMYPQPQEVAVTPPKLAEQLCGDFRPGHFQGVVTVVTKLFNIVRPDTAVFGKKDYQQLHVIRALVRQLNFGIEIVGVDTVREVDGLAMSSRNGYLSREERAEAVRLSRVLAHLKSAIEGGESAHETLVAAARDELASHGWRVDYVALRSQANLAPVGPADRELVVLAAAWLGQTRLIDNLEIRVRAR
ncbi:MAG TPA: pantoate--beta-alanine ligase [Usitatibacter sp.]|nr:pantoate--beta-alanine ligase [Usitatibacter sp.]